MNLNITGRHVDVTPAIREYVESKLDRVLRHYDSITSTAVTLSVEKLKQKVEVTVRARGKDIFVESEDNDLYAAVDGMIDKLDRQMQKYKQKQNEHNYESVRHQQPEED
ncbi:MAG: ribosome-associated translation inhibitor RaiA [Thauera sp.]|jgi:putative sigma-54 modulation protein|nr:ribosome-associated translation inhibitor RaiA [Thauera sp.]